MSTVTAEISRDFLAKCVVATTGNPVLEQIRDKGADALLAIFRLSKNALIHAVDNQAVIQSAAQSQRILAEFSAVVGGNVSVTFLQDTIFVCGQLLRASRAVYESAAELGTIFGRCDVSEVSIDGAVTPQDLLTFASALSISVRDPARRTTLIDARISHIVVRKLEAELQRREDSDDALVRERILRLYASALVVMRSFFDSIAQGATLLPHRVKRLSQRFVAMAETGDAALLGLTAMAGSHRDDAGRAVLGAILAVVVGRQITTERVALARLAMAALMADCGRVRLAGLQGRDRLVALPESVEASVPPTTAAICLATGGVNVPNALRTVVTTEATWMERESLLGPVYARRMSPLVESQILRLVRTVLDQLAPRDATVQSKSPLDALQAVAATPGIDPVLLRLLLNAVGIIPTGSVIEFETGEWGVVMGASKTPGAFDRPIVRLVTDRKGRVLNPPREVDLGAPSAGRVFPRIANVINPNQARFNVAGVFVA